MTDVTPDAYRYTSDDGSVELVLDCHGEQARRLIELGYTESPLYARSAEPADALDWHKIEALAREHGIRYRTCKGMAAFLAALTRTDALAEAREAMDDALAGWRYIRATHGDLYGVGWDRVEARLTAALSRLNAQGEVK